MLTDEVLLKMDLYVFIGVTPEASKADIKKAFKVKARDVHPDKNPDPKAGELFDKLHTIYNFLRDDKKRESYDKQRQQQAVRKRKLEEEDSGRSNLRKELERREEAFRLSKLKENQLSEAEKSRLQTAQKIEEMIAKGIIPPSSTPSTSSAKTPRSASSSSTSFASPISPASASSASSTGPATVMIAWQNKKEATGWQGELRLILERYGEVAVLIVKKKTAVAVFGTSLQAAAAVTAHHCHPELKFRLQEEPAGSPIITATTAPVSKPPVARYDDDYEAQTLQMLMRRQQEKREAAQG